MYDFETIPAGTTLIEEGLADTRLLMLESGTVAITKNGVQITELSERGTFIGELSAILRTPRSCTVKTVTECDVLILAEDIETITQHNPVLTQRILRELAQRVVDATRELAAVKHEVLAFQSELPTS